jgi:hypothetical protein
MHKTGKLLCAVGAAFSLAFGAVAAQAGPVFLTGHDPDFHAQGQDSGQNELIVALNFVTGGTYASGTAKFLFVESNLPVIGGHRVGKNGLTGNPALNQGLGLVEGVNFDQVDAAGLASVDFSNYSAIVVASTFGGMLSEAEILGLVARKADIATFVNAGGGLAAFSECGVGFPNCQSELVTSTTPLFGFVPVSASAVATAAPYHVTAYGASLGLTDADVDDCCTHNSFADAAGLNIVDLDLHNIPTTLAGIVRITGGGFESSVPEPASWILMILGIGAVGARLRARPARRMAAS